jgi:hypothetical protein
VASTEIKSFQFLELFVSTVTAFQINNKIFRFKQLRENFIKLCFPNKIFDLFPF